MKVVGIGGGTGLPVVLRGLKSLKVFHGRDEPAGHIDITAIVTVSDSGGSTGLLRSAFGMPAIGDIRNCLLSLATADSTLASVCGHRFSRPDELAGHSLGNLVLSALYETSGDFSAAIRQASEMLRVDGCVLPSTESPVTLCALYDDGNVAEGEANVPNTEARISRVWLQPDDPKPAPGVMEALEAADIIVIGPGSLYTSIIPNLLVEDLARAIHASKAVKVYVMNLMTQPGETDGYSAADHVRELVDYLGSAIDVCILNSSPVGTPLADRYSQSGSVIVGDTPEAQEQIRSLGVIPVAAPLLKDGESKARHDPLTLARLIVSLAAGFRAAPGIICGEGNGR